MTALVGADRRALVDALAKRFAVVCESGEPALVTLVAPAGEGKTRIVQELYRRVVAQRGGGYFPAELVPVASADFLQGRSAVSPALDDLDREVAPDLIWWGATLGVDADTRALSDDLTLLVLLHDTLVYHMGRSPIRRRMGRGLKEVGKEALIEGPLTAAGLAGDALFGDAVGAAIGPLAGLFRAGMEGFRSPTIPAEYLWVEPARMERAVAKRAAALVDVAHAGTPVVIVIDAAHHADDGLCTAIEVLVTSQAPVLVLATAWPEREDLSPIGQLAARIGPRTAERWRLHPLKAGELATLARAVVPELPPEIAEQVGSRLGNPLAVRGFLALEAVQRCIASTTFDGVVDELSAHGESLAELYGSYLAELPPAIRRILALAYECSPLAVEVSSDRSYLVELLAHVVAVHGPDFDLDDDNTPPDGALLRRGIVRDRVIFHEFSDALTAAAAGRMTEATLEKGARDAVLVTVATRIATSHVVTHPLVGSRVRSHLAAVVPHLASEHATEAMVGALVTAGRTEAEDGAWHAARPLAEGAVAFAVYLPRSIRAATLRLRGWVRGEMGDHEGAIDDLRDCRALLPFAQRSDLLQVTANLTEWLLSEHRLDEAATNIGELATEPGGLTPEVLFHLRRSLAVAYAQIGDVQSAGRAFADLRDMATSVGDGDSRRVGERIAALGEAWALVLNDSAAEGLVLAREVLHGVLSAHARPVDRAEALRIAGHAQRRLGHPGDARSSFEQASRGLVAALGEHHPEVLENRMQAVLTGAPSTRATSLDELRGLTEEYAEELGVDHPAHVRALDRLGWLAGQRGALQEAVHRLEEALRIKQSVSLLGSSTVTKTRLNLAWVLSGRMVDSEVVAVDDDATWMADDAVRAWVERHGGGPDLAWFQQKRGWIHVRCEDVTGGRTILREALSTGTKLLCEGHPLIDELARDLATDVLAGDP